MVQIITDSSSLYTVEEAVSCGFESVPLCITIGDLEGRDLQIDMDDYYDRIYSGQVPLSSQPPIGDVVDCFDAHKEEDIIAISMADGLSGTYHGACMAKELSENKERITVINSRTLCGPHRYMVEMAQKMKQKGASKEEIVDWIMKKTKQTDSFLIPQDFSFLKRGGRLTPVAAALGSVLKLRPVMKLTEDAKRLDKFAVKRTMTSAFKVVVEELQERKLGANHIFYVAHARAKEDAMKAKAMLEEAFAGAEIQILELSPVFVAQGGPKCVAIQYIER